MPRVPQLRRHKGRRQAYVKVAGRMTYFGKWPDGQAEPSAEALQAYKRYVTRLLAGLPSGPVVAKEPPSVAEVVLAYLTFAEGYYQKGGEPTAQVARIKGAARALVDLHGSRPAEDLTADDLELVRAALLDRPCRACAETGRLSPRGCPACKGRGWTKGRMTCAACKGARKVERACKRCAGTGRRQWVRKLVNQSVGCLKAMWAWAARKGLIPAEAAAQWGLVRGLRRGQGGREPARIRPVPDEVLEATLAQLGPVPAAMVRLQALTGMRPHEVCELRAGEVDRQGADPDGVRHAGLWVYVPAHHKTEHHEGHERVVFLGPLAQALLAPLLDGLEEGEYVFSPLRAVRDGLEKAGRRVRHGRGRKPGEHYTTASYGRAIAAACKRAGVPRWAPNRLRHLAATRVRAAFGLDVAGAVLGHSSLTVTTLYAEQAAVKAAQAMRTMG